MRSISGLKRICDISFFMTFASMFLWIFDDSSGLILTLPLFVISAFLSAFLAHYGTAKYAGLLPLGLIFLFITPSILQLIVLILAFFYLIWNMPNANEQVSQFQYKKTFKAFIMIFVVIIAIYLFLLFVGATAGNFAASGIRSAEFSYDVLLFAFSFLILSIIFLRLIRHEAIVLTETRFKLMSSVSVIGILFGAILLSNNAFIFLILNAIRFVWLNVFANIIPGIAWLFTLPFRNINQPSRYVEHEEIEFDRCEGGVEIMGMCFEEGADSASNPVFWEIILAISIIALIILLIILVKKLSNKINIAEPIENGIKEERLAFKVERSKKAARLDNQIRIIYQKFLTLLKKEELELDDHLTSLEVEELVGQTFDSKKSNLLREIYIKIRYGEQQFTSADLNQARGLYKEIKKEIGKRA